MIPLRDSIRPRRRPIVNPALILANVLVFFYQLTLGHEQLFEFFVRYGVVPARFQGVLGFLYLVLSGQWAIPATVVTAMFLHGGWMHLIGNMLYLWVFGDNVEDRLGRLGYLLFYLAAGVVANLAQVAADPSSTTPLIGASGAVAGVLGAYFVTFPRSRVLALVPLGFFITMTEVPAVLFLFLWFALQLLNGVASIGFPQIAGQIAWWAHIGGFVAGMLLIRWFRRRAPLHPW